MPGTKVPVGIAEVNAGTGALKADCRTGGEKTGGWKAVDIAEKGGGEGGDARKG